MTNQGTISGVLYFSRLISDTFSFIDFGRDKLLAGLACLFRYLLFSYEKWVY
jgi:hypothetical protein